MGRTRDFAEVIRRKLASDRPLAEAVNDEYVRLNVAGQIFAARKKAGMTQRELAEACGMKQSAIARLESTDYEGHRLDTVRRIAAALNLRIEITFVPPPTLPPMNPMMLTKAPPGKTIDTKTVAPKKKTSARRKSK